MDTSIQGWVPPRQGWGTALARDGVLPWLEMGYLLARDGVPHPRMGTPQARDGVPPQAGMGYPPSQRWGTPLARYGVLPSRDGVPPGQGLDTP